MLDDQASSTSLQQLPQATSLHYGWWITFIAFLMLTITNGMTLSGLTVFDAELIKTFECSREALKRGELIQLLSAGFLAPFIGYIADRSRLSIIIVTGLALISAGLYGYSVVTSLNQLYLIRAAFGVGLACAGLVMAVLMVSRWFKHQRGLAIGLTLVGSSLGNIIFAKFNPQLINHDLGEGWRQAFPTLAWIPIALIPLVFLLVRDHPTETVTQDDEQAAPTTHLASDTSVTYHEAIRGRQFWLIASAAMMTFYSILGVASHLPLYLNQSAGMTMTEAGGMVGVVFGMSLVGKLVWGVLADYFNHRRLFSFNLALMGMGSLMLNSMDLSLFKGFLICFGFGWGGLYTLIQLLVVGSFGVRDAGRILGTITLLDAIGGGLGPWLTGYLFDLSQSYFSSFTVITTLITVVFLSSFALKPLAHENHNTDFDQNALANKETSLES